MWFQVVDNKFTTEPQVKAGVQTSTAKFILNGDMPAEMQTSMQLTHKYLIGCGQATDAQPLTRALSKLVSFRYQSCTQIKCIVVGDTTQNSKY